MNWTLNLKGLNEERHEIFLSTLLSGWQLDTEMEWMRQYLEQLKSPVVFCHNDLQEGNILIREKAVSREEKLVIIDFEYCSYNYRGFDLANHFCESVYEYTNDKSPNFTANQANMPSTQQKVTSFSLLFSSPLADLLLLMDYLLLVIDN